MQTPRWKCLEKYKWVILGWGWSINAINEQDSACDWKKKKWWNNFTLWIGFLFHKCPGIFSKRENYDINDKEIVVDSILISFQTYLPRGLQFSTLFSIFTAVEMFRKKCVNSIPYKWCDNKQLFTIENRNIALYVIQ